MSTQPTPRTRWVPIESTPETFNSYAQKLGMIMSQHQFVDLYGFDDELLDLIPKPAKAVVLVFLNDQDAQERNRVENERIVKDGQPKLDPTIFWTKQTIDNACGTMALIHSLANSDVAFTPTSAFQKFLIEARDKSPEERIKLLENNADIARIHTEEAAEGTSAPRIDTDLHYTCFVTAPDADVRRAADGDQTVVPTASHQNEAGMRLVELDGDRVGPIDRGPCTDLLKDAVAFIKAHHLPAAKSVELNVLVLAPTQD